MIRIDLYWHIFIFHCWHVLNFFGHIRSQYKLKSSEVYCLHASIVPWGQILNWQITQNTACHHRHMKNSWTWYGHINSMTSKIIDKPKFNKNHIVEASREWSWYFLLSKLDPVFSTLYSMENTTWQLLTCNGNQTTKKCETEKDIFMKNLATSLWSCGQ
jgi:hypothetical protein